MAKKTGYINKANMYPALFRSKPTDVERAVEVIN